MHSRSFGESLGNAFIHALSTVDDINERFDFMNESIRIGLIIRDKDEFVIDEITVFDKAGEPKPFIIEGFSYLIHNSLAISAAFAVDIFGAFKKGFNVPFVHQINKKLPFFFGKRMSQQNFIMIDNACAASAEIAIKPKGFEKRRHSTDGSSGIDENQMPIFLSSSDG